MSEDLKDKKARERFFFNKNIFDEDYIPEEEEPPAPTFSEQELEEAKKNAYNKGLQQGREEAAQEAAQSIEKAASEALKHIASDTGILFAQEEARAQLFEREAVALSAKIFDSLFPLYREHVGFDELVGHIKSVLEKHQKQPKITIYVAEQSVQGVRDQLSQLGKDGHSGTFEVVGDANLSGAACRLSWPDGGAAHNIDAIAQEIKSILQEILAGSDTKGHNTEGDAPAQDTNTPSDATASHDDEQFDAPENQTLDGENQ